MTNAHVHTDNTISGL